ncbi:MAG: hypothetical protein H6Q60_1488 [Oscillospiraceae bacterium]|nr:hypothetical protein [Oscillospiraceae bacterium]
MNQYRVWRGIGAGVLAGAAVGLLMTPAHSSRGGRHGAGKAMRTVGNMIDSITDVMR